jgi:hypothetical protein
VLLDSTSGDQPKHITQPTTTWRTTTSRHHRRRRRTTSTSSCRHSDQSSSSPGTPWPRGSSSSGASTTSCGLTPPGSITMSGPPSLLLPLLPPTHEAEHHVITAGRPGVRPPPPPKYAPLRRSMHGWSGRQDKYKPCYNVGRAACVLQMRHYLSCHRRGQQHRRRGRDSGPSQRIHRGRRFCRHRRGPSGLRSNTEGAPKPICLSLFRATILLRPNKWFALNCSAT